MKSTKRKNKLRAPFFYLLVLLFSISCTERENEKLIAEIIETQEKNEKIRKDTSLRELKMLDEEIQVSKYVPDPLKAENDFLLGLSYKEEGDWEKAGIYLNRATTYAKAPITNRQDDYFYFAWSFYFRQELWGDCITISNRFKSLLSTEDFDWWALYYYYVENVNKKTNKYEEALKANRSRITMLEKSGDPYHTIPNALISKAASKYDQGKKQEAIDILDSLILHQKALNADQKRHLFGDYGTYQFKDKKYKKALSSYLLALKYKSRKSRNKLATSYCNIAECYLYLKEYDKSKTYLDSVRFLGIKNISTELQKSYYKYEVLLASATNKKLNNVAKPIDEVFGLLDEEYAKKYDKELDALQLAHQRERNLLVEQQKADKSELELRSIILFLCILLPAIVLASVFFFRQRRYKLEQDNLLMQQRLLRSQMNPHFIFNFLYAIQNQIKESPKLASKYLVKFSRLLRLILENSTQNYIELDKELESLTKYMDLQLLRFPNKFKYEIEIEDIEEEESIFIPPMLLQPMVENSIEHGFSSINYAGKILIKLSVKDKFIHASIEDNGVGIRETINPTKQSNSVRLISDFLKKTTNQKIKIINKTDLPNEETGVKVNFLIPYKFHKND